MLKFIPLSALALLLLVVSVLQPIQTKAQVRQQFTGSNIISLGFETNDKILEFASDHLLVRYIKEQNKLECRLPVNSLYTLSDSIDSSLAYEVLFGSKYPEIVILIDVPDDIVNSPAFTEEPLMVRSTIEFQGTPNEKRIPVQFISEQGAIIVSTAFDIRMSHFRATIPARYLPLLTGRVIINIRNARWLNNPK